MSRVQIPPHLAPVLQQAAAQSGVPVNVLAAMLQHESGWRPDARGAAGEIGIAQILPTTAARPGYGLPPLALAALGDPNQAIPWAANYLSARARSAGVRDWNDPAQAARGLAAYNGAGPRAEQYGRTVAEMSGRVAPSEPVRADSGDAPVRPMQWPEPKPEVAQESDVSRVMRALQMANYLVGGY